MSSSSVKVSVKSCTCGRVSSCISTGWVLTSWKAYFTEKVLRVLVDTKWNINSNAPFVTKNTLGEILEAGSWK